MVRARKLFDAFDDKRRCAQVDDSLARIHLARGRFKLAEQAAGQAVKTFEAGFEGYLAESLTTQGLVLCRLGRHREAKRILDRAYQVAERGGDSESACTALLILIENMGAHLTDEERLELIGELDRFTASSQTASAIKRIKNAGDL